MRALARKSLLIGLKCRSCGAIYPPEKMQVCTKCLEPVDPVYDLDAFSTSKEEILRRPRGLWRYAELLPIEDLTNVVDIGAGFTPLTKAENLSRELGSRLYIKNDGTNPTGSFKDRPAGVAISKAREWGDKVVGAASTGNLAASVAAYAAKAGLKCYIFAPASTEIGKVSQTLVYGARIILVDGTYDEANRMAHIASEELGWNIVNVTTRPYYAEGSKTLAYEVAEQLGWRLPDHIVVPTASGSLLYALHRGINELVALGLVEEKEVKLHAAQAAGCAPIANSFKKGLDRVEPVEHPNTIARGLAIGDPGDGDVALKVVRERGGRAEAVTDDEILNGINLLAKHEGIFTEPAGGVVVATTRRLIEEGYIGRDEEVVLLITATGLKTMELIERREEQIIRIKPTISDLLKVRDVA